MKAPGSSTRIFASCCTFNGTSGTGAKAPGSEALAVLGGHIPVPQNDTGERPAGHPEFEAGPDFGSGHRSYVETLNATCAYASGCTRITSPSSTCIVNERVPLAEPL